MSPRRSAAGVLRPRCESACKGYRHNPRGGLERFQTTRPRREIPRFPCHAGLPTMGTNSHLGIQLWAAYQPVLLPDSDERRSRELRRFFFWRARGRLRGPPGLSIDGGMLLLTPELALHNWVVALAGQLHLHRLGVLDGGKRANLHVVELVVGDGIVHHEDVVVFLAQRTRQRDRVVFP